MFCTSDINIDTLSVCYFIAADFRTVLQISVTDISTVTSCIVSLYCRVTADLPIFSALLDIF